MNIKNIVIGGLAVLALLFGYLYLSRATTLFGAVTGQIHYQLEQFVVGLKIGSRNATELAYLQTGTCSLIASSFTVAASTTVAMDCAVSGAKSGDKVFASFASPSLTGNGWHLSGAAASTTAGFDTFLVTNFTGASAVVPSTIASSTQFLNLR